MSSSGEGPSPQPRAGGSRRHGRGAGERRRVVSSQWSLLAVSRRDGGATAAAGARSRARLPWAAAGATQPRLERTCRDDAGAEFVIQAMQRAFQ